MRSVLQICAVLAVLMAGVWGGAGNAAAQDTYVPVQKNQPESTIAPIGESSARRACTQMWCQEGYLLHINAPSWPAGVYSFKVIADDTVYNCQGVLPLQSCGKPSVTCNDRDISIAESGCAMDASTHAFNGIMLKKIPEHISVNISGPNGSVIHEGMVNKQCSYPNGKQCDPRQCCAAIDYMTISW